MAVATSHNEHTQADTRNGLLGAMPRPVNVLMVGAGSFFTNSVLKDVILIPDNVGGELRLVDIDAERLVLTERLINKILVEVAQDHKWRVVASTKLRARLFERLAPPERSARAADMQVAAAGVDGADVAGAAGSQGGPGELLSFRLRSAPVRRG